MAASMSIKYSSLCQLCGRRFPTYIQRRSLQQDTKDSSWKGVIGLEIHAQIQTKSKLFSGASTKYGGATNNQVALLDAALPGTLPVLNKQCVEAGILTAMALKCKINKISKFDRKHYFYADLPAGYQITQQRQPLAVEGHVNYLNFTPGIEGEPEPKTVNLEQLQLEQDSGKSLHDEANQRSLIDLNRAGVGLMEIVTKPDFSNGTEAASFVRELQLILKTVGSCNCKMNEGSMRVDANISVHKEGEPYGTRTEVKNLNSLLSVTKSIDYEIQRQIKEIEEGREIENETRSFDVNLGKTVPMRDKEKKQDYRFMPEPNLPPLHLYDNSSVLPSNVNQNDILNLDVIKEKLPALPEETRNRLVQQYGITPRDSLLVLMDDGLLEFYESVMKFVDKDLYKLASEFVVKTCKGVLRSMEMNYSDLPISLEAIAEISTFFAKDIISSKSAAKLLEIMIQTKDENVAELVKQHDMEQINDIEVLTKACQSIIEKSPKKVKKIKNGKKKEFGVLAQFVVNETDGKGNIRLIMQILREELINNE
ncbi:hypothetical protein KUTeg_024583 [Tegillarca granosa]|uniref:Glutamyl-tRNA(Gln) amidotransferase subunit B, mitochondrial n=1 Tax=Tegillarca granosa TaxID=220873 RepID=A0ABQ9E2E8_TEGGR|nr:hypothetical protein KUTeg_024583 [Tegillarca granosa]